MKQSLSIWLQNSERTLRESAIDTARLDTLVLLQDELGVDKSWILAHPEYIMDASHIKHLNTKIIQRSQHVPLAYIRGHAEFYGRDYIVNRNVLVPRPESESIIDLLKTLPLDQQASINNEQDATSAHRQSVVVDVGTGSGCLAITAKYEFIGVDIIATDISSSALSTAKRNSLQLGAPVTFTEGDLLLPALDYIKDFDQVIILANLPYVPEGYPINHAAMHEPKLALFSSNNGLEHYERLFKQVDKITTRNCSIITESLMDQHVALVTIAKNAGFILTAADGLAQAFVRCK